MAQIDSNNNATPPADHISETPHSTADIQDHLVFYILRAQPGLFAKGPFGFVAIRGIQLGQPMAVPLEAEAVCVAIGFHEPLDAADDRVGAAASRTETSLRIRSGRFNRAPTARAD